MKRASDVSAPTREQLERELEREIRKRDCIRTLWGTAGALSVMAAFTILAAAFLKPLRISGSSMAPALREGEIVIVLRGTEPARGDKTAFYHNGQILMKRVIALPGECVRIDEDGNIYVDEVLLEESYLAEGAKAYGECDISFPYQVPEGQFFVLGDNRKVSVDSRSKEIGCVHRGQIVGKLIFRLWPVRGIGPVQ